MISVFGSDFDDREFESLRSPLLGQWTGMGKQTLAFESAMKERLGCTDFVMTDSGSNALWLALEVLQLPKGSEVILPSFTWAACANAIVLAGLKPVFCDVEEESGNLSAETVRPCITTNTSAILVVHYAGKAVDMPSLLALGFPVLEDAAHAIDTKIKNQAVGTFGYAGVFSFDSVKNLASSEAGGIAFQNAEHAEKARQLRYCGLGSTGFRRAEQNANNKWWETEVLHPFPKMLPDDLAASIALTQLEKLPQMQEKRKRIFERYQECLHSFSWIQIPTGPDPGETHSYFTWLGRFERRDELARYLLSKEIYTTLRYHPLHFSKVFHHCPKLPNTENLATSGLNLPLHPRMTEDDQESILSALRAFKG